MSSLQGTICPETGAAHLSDTIKLLQTKIHCYKACSLLPSRHNRSSSPKSLQSTPRAPSVSFSSGRNGCDLKPPPSRASLGLGTHGIPNPRALWVLFVIPSHGSHCLGEEKEMAKSRLLESHVLLSTEITEWVVTHLLQCHQLLKGREW